MATNYARHVSAKLTPQSEPIPGSGQVANDAGGYAFAVTHWTQLDRFLVLGNEGGSYYVGERKMTQESAACVLRCAEEDPARTVARIVSVSKEGGAPKNDPAIFTLALLSNHPKASALALAAVPAVCRIPTHLFAFAEMAQELRGWGRGLKRAVADWYLLKPPRELAYQCAKYQSRNGWTHRDLLRLSHPKAQGTTQEVLHWAVKGWENVGDSPHDNVDLVPIWALERAKRATSAVEIAGLVRDFGLVRECIPTQFLSEASVWEALLEKMPPTALVRNLATMTRIGLLAPLSAATKTACARLADAELLKKARLHPMAILIALRTYAAGHGERGSNTWEPVQQVVDTLDAAFASVESTGQRWLLGLDVSGSMRGQQVVGTPFLSAVEAEAAMALVTAATEPQHALVAFDTLLHPVNISPRQRLDNAVAEVNRLVNGGTDCSLPMIHATRSRIPVDVFAIYTDSQTWQGQMHPVQALKVYREAMEIPAKLIIIAMAANSFSVGADQDAGILNVAGFDANVPGVLRAFACER